MSRTLLHMSGKLLITSPATWDSPPRETDVGYAAFQDAFRRFIASRSVVVPTKRKDLRTEDAAAKFNFNQSRPDLGQAPELKLMPFQVDGVNWLCKNYLSHQNCILADEMGLVRNACE